MLLSFFRQTDKVHQMTIIVLNGPTNMGPTNIEPRLPKNAPKWPSMEAPPSYHESMELTTAVLSPPIIDYRSGWLIGNPVEETDNGTTNNSRNAEYTFFYIKFCVCSFVGVFILWLILLIAHGWINASLSRLTLQNIGRASYASKTHVNTMYQKIHSPRKTLRINCVSHFLTKMRRTILWP